MPRCLSIDISIDTNDVQMLVPGSSGRTMSSSASEGKMQPDVSRIGHLSFRTGAWTIWILFQCVIRTNRDEARNRNLIITYGTLPCRKLGSKPREGRQ